MKTGKAKLKCEPAALPGYATTPFYTNYPLTILYLAMVLIMILVSGFYIPLHKLE